MTLFFFTKTRLISDFLMQDVLVDTRLLMKKSLQKGILQLRDKEDNTQRATRRVEVLHGLLQNKYAGVSMLNRTLLLWPCYLSLNCAGVVKHLYDTLLHNVCCSSALA